MASSLTEPDDGQFAVTGDSKDLRVFGVRSFEKGYVESKKTDLLLTLFTFLRSFSLPEGTSFASSAA